LKEERLAIIYRPIQKLLVGEMYPREKV